MLAFLLAAAVTTAAPATQALLAAASPQERLAGCHEHLRQVPAPGPASHRCCQAGHHAAVLQPSLALRAPMAYLAMPLPASQLRRVARAWENLAERLTTPGDPPGPAALRI